MNKSVVIHTYKVMDIGFSHTECELDETEFNINADLDETDTITEVMNLFADFINENNYTNVHNINVYQVCKLNVFDTYEDGKLISTEEKEVYEDD